MLESVSNTWLPLILVLVVTGVVAIFCLIFRDNPIPGVMMVAAGCAWIFTPGLQENEYFLWIGIFIAVMGAVMTFYRFKNLRV